MAKRLIRLFGFTVHNAPGEAEAECALLQQQGIVDAVLSEDVDTIMFGCTRTLRNWSSETKGNKTPTHVSVYDAAELRQSESGLGREGMVLVALMSGGDYIPEGIPGCGVKVACEAAKAGFGHSLCRIKMADKKALAEWKENLLHELRTNASDYFRTRHKALAIPESFPNMEVLRYYTHPVISQQTTLDKLKDTFPSKTPVDIVGLREFARDTFDWSYKIGAIKLIRVLAPSLLVRALVDRSERGPAGSDDLDTLQKDEATLVKAISSRRSHFSTDATPELRISYIPASLVQLDLDAEPQEVVAAHGRDGLALNSDDEFEEDAAEEGLEAPSKAANKKGFDPLQPELIWIPRSIAKLGVPLAVEDWEEQQRSKKSRVAAKTTRKLRPRKTDMPAGALDRWVKTSKPSKVTTEKGIRLQVALSSPPNSHISAICLGQHDAAHGAPSSPLSHIAREPSSTARGKKPKKSKVPAAAADLPTARTNPWTIAGSQVSPSVTKTASSPPGKSSREPIVIASSPHPGPPSPPLGTDMRTKQPQSPLAKSSTAPDSNRSPTTSSPNQQDLSLPAEKIPKQRKLVLSRGRPRNENKPGEGAQTSIKAYGQLTKVVSTRANTEGLENLETIELSGDEDGGPPVQKLVAEVSNNPSPELLVEGNNGDVSKPELPGGGKEAPTTEADAESAEGGGAWLAEGGSKTTRLYISRISDIGYFKEVDVVPEEADRLDKAQGGASGSQTILRESDVSVIDLTTRG